MIVCSSFSATAFADQFDDQIAALKQQANSQQATANQFAAQASDYQTRVNQLNAQIGALQAQINLGQAEFNKVTSQIAANEANLADKKSVLGANLKSMYVDSTVTPLEMIASSSNLSEYFNQQQYQDTIKDKIQSAMADILATQIQLAAQKTQVEALLALQATQKQQLSATRAEANQLLAAASQSAATANAQVAASNGQINSLHAQQAAILAANSRKFSGSIPGASGGSGGACDNGNGNGGYPQSWCSAGQDAPGYGGAWGYNRECVSWAGWRRANMGRPLPTGWGNANTWTNNAISFGYTVNRTPEVGAVAQTNAGPYGHVAVVEAIQGDTVIVSEMNYDGDGHFRYGKYSKSYFNYIH